MLTHRAIPHQSGGKEPISQSTVPVETSEFDVPSCHIIAKLMSSHVRIPPLKERIRLIEQGIYSVSIDAGEPEFFSGFASGDGQFQAVLFATTGLADSEHTLKIANENSRNIEQYPKYIYLDVDYFALTGEL
jgi:hypothetical protein